MVKQKLRRAFLLDIIYQVFDKEEEEMNVKEEEQELEAIQVCDIYRI